MAGYMLQSPGYCCSYSLVCLQPHKLEITGTGGAVKLCFCRCTGVKKEEEGQNVKQTAFLKQIVLERVFFSDIL